MTLVLAAGGYTAFWFIAAARLQSGAGQLAEALRKQDVALSWQSLRVGGFPLALRVTLRGVELRDRRPAAPSLTRLPRARADAAPWNFAVWQIAAPDGVEIGVGQPPGVTLSAPQAAGRLRLAAAGGVAAAVDLSRPQLAGGVRLTAQSAAVQLSLPPRPPQTADDRVVAIAVDARTVALPTLALPTPLRNPLDELAVAVTLRGPVPPKPPREAATAWRDAGGTADIDRFMLRSGALIVDGSGTLALDRDLQPEGAFSLTIEDFPALLDALVAAGRLHRRAAGLARLALSLVEKPGPDGKPAIKTPLRMQDGKLFLGPLSLGPAPHIDW